MRKPDIPSNEADRLAALRAYQVLDTTAEASFDSITKLVASTLKVPIALISLIDEHRQWFKSRQGLDVAETGRDISFCGHVVAAGAPLIVPDASKDERFADNPLVTGEPRIRFYAGVPLRTPAGFDVGTLCAIDQVPHELGPDQLEQLSALAAMVVEQLESRHKLAILRRVADGAPGLLAYWDANERCLFANAAYELWFGLKSDGVIGKTLRELLGPIYPLNKPFIDGALRGEPQHFEREIPDPTGGLPRYSQAEYVPHVVQGRVHGFAVMVTDISARKRLDDRLVEKESQLRGLLDAMVEGVVLQLSSGQIVSSNPAAEVLLGLTHDQLIGRSSLDPHWRAIHGDGSPFPGEAHPAMETLRTGEAQTNVLMGVHKPSGVLSWISINTRPIGGTGDRLPDGVVCTFRDVTDERAAEQRAARLATQERLVTTGTLAAGVGHEINNPLVYVLGNLDYALEDLRAIAGGSPTARMSDLIEMLDEARAGAERIRKIVRGLRALARDDSPLAPTEVHVAFEMAVNMTMHEVRRRATVVGDFEGIPTVLADESRLTQVLVNLLANAAQAFTTDDPDRNQIQVTVSTIDKSVRISVKDNGPGIAPDVLPRIFDPFFTTKPIGQGTGLGLSISHSIVTTLGGELSCETVVGKGTTFHLVLASAEVPDPVAPDAHNARSTVRGRILIVDDDEIVRRSLERLLRAEHEVVSFSDPREALKVLLRGDRFDVILCDLMMPYLTGPDLHRRVSEFRPELARRFIFITGGVLDRETDAFLARVPNERFEKPIGLQTLRSAVRRFLL